MSYEPEHRDGSGGIWLGLISAIAVFVYILNQIPTLGELPALLTILILIGWLVVTIGTFLIVTFIAWI